MKSTVNSRFIAAAFITFLTVIDAAIIWVWVQVGKLLESIEHPENKSLSILKAILDLECYSPAFNKHASYVNAKQWP